MLSFSRDVLEAAAREREVQFTTYGRTTGRPHTVTIWVWGDGQRLFIRSGQGLGRDWPQNLVARGKGVLHLAAHDVPVTARHVTTAEARSLSDLVERKYEVNVARSGEGQSPTPAEQATFELFPSAAG